MELVRARPGHHVEHRAGVAAILGAKGVGQHIDLPQRVRRRIVQAGIAEGGVKFRAVEQEQVLVPAGT